MERRRPSVAQAAHYFLDAKAGREEAPPNVYDVQLLLSNSGESGPLPVKNSALPNPCRISLLDAVTGVLANG